MLCLCGAAAWWDPRAIDYKRSALCGALLGAVLLCKIQGALLVPAVAAWATYHAGHTHGWKSAWRAVGPVAAFGGVGAVVFFVGWPYFWVDLWNNPAAFLATIVDRAPVRNFYLGSVWNGDGFEPTPWHYPLVMTLATVPVGLSALAIYGGARRRAGGAGPPVRSAPGSRSGWTTRNCPCSDSHFSSRWPSSVPADRACTTACGCFLSFPPPLALLCGVGVGRLYDRLRTWRPRLAVPAVVALLAVQGVNVVWMSPVWLSSYSAVVGGLWGGGSAGVRAELLGGTR